MFAIVAAIGSLHCGKPKKSESGLSPMCWFCLEVKRIGFVIFKRNMVQVLTAPHYFLSTLVYNGSLVGFSFVLCCLLGCFSEIEDFIVIVKVLRFSSTCGFWHYFGVFKLMKYAFVICLWQS